MTKLAIIAVAGLAAVASANPLTTNTQGSATNVVNGNDLFEITRTNTRDNNQIITITAISDIDYSFGFPAATAFLIDLGGGNPVYVNGIGWNTTHQTTSPSWLSEFRTEFTDNPTTLGVGLNVSGTAAPGGPENNSSGIVDLVGLALDFTLADGMLLLSFWDTFDDFGGGVEGTLLAGSTYDLQVKIIPAPGALALLGLGGVAAIRRRR
jgi:hypothetical protein